MLRRVLPLLILAFAVGGFVWLKSTRPKSIPVMPQERAWRVQAQPVSAADHRPELALFGRVEAPDRVRLTAPVSGRLLELLVRDGERVQEGSLLARLDPRDLEPRLARVRAELEQESLRYAHDQEALKDERELLELARKSVERADKVQSRNLGTASDVDQAREQLARARLAVRLREQAIAEHPARLAALQASLAEAERDSSRAEMHAPFDARIGTVDAAAGEQLQPNQTILTLYPLDDLYLRAKVPGAHAAELRRALAAGERLEARVNFAGREFTAVLERISGEADARGVDALLHLDTDADMPLGAFVDLRLQRPSAADTIALPFAALHGGDRVFSVADGRLQAVPVERIGEVSVDGTTQVLVRAPDLAADARVLVTHLPNAVQGLKVEEVTGTDRPPTESPIAERTLD